VGIVAQSLAQLLHRGRDAVFELDDRIAGPHLRPNLVLSDYVTCVFEQKDENLKRLILQLDFSIVFLQLASRKIDAERAESRRT